MVMKTKQQPKIYVVGLLRGVVDEQGETRERGEVFECKSNLAQILVSTSRGMILGEKGDDKGIEKQGAIFKRQLKEIEEAREAQRSANLRQPDVLERFVDKFIEKIEAVNTAKA